MQFEIRHQEGIGLGDAKLLAVVGGFLGWEILPVLLLLASVQGLLVLNHLAGPPGA